MARLTNIKLRRSGTSGNVPTTSQLDLGELAINTYDGKLYLKKNVGGTESIVDVGSNQSAVYKEYVYTATANQTTFSGSDDNSQTLTYITGFLQVFLNGVLLENGTDYTANTLTSVILVNGASAGDILQISTFVKVLGTGDIVTDTFTGNGTTPNYTLSATPDNEDNIIVFADGVYQEKSTYSVSGTTLTFNANLPNGVTAEVVIGSNNVTLTDIADLNLGGDLTVASGSVGIGTSSPDANLDIESNLPTIRLTETDDSTYSEISQSFGYLTINNDAGNSGTGDAIIFKIDNSEKVRFTSGGNVGIGTSSPASNLHIKTSVDNSVAQGLIIERSLNSDRGYINYNGGGFQFRSTVGDPIVFGETDAEHMKIIPDGNVGIGNTLPKAKLQVEEYGINTTETSTTATTQVAIHTFAAADFRSARYSIQVTNSTDSTYHISTGAFGTERRRRVARRDKTG